VRKERLPANGLPSMGFSVTSDGWLQGTDHVSVCPGAPFGERSGAAAVQRTRMLCLK